MTDIERLRELAEKATPGPWVPVLHEDGDGGFVDADDVHEVSTADRSYDIAVAVSSLNAAYIASVSPDILLTLLDRLEAAEDELSDLKDWLDGAGYRTPKAELQPTPPPSES